ncbi:MAG: hypothetical protein LBI20_03830 [Holosporales bacterium]|jgi:4-diphosphocytidyl-2-C-methyl-D-erythritol kinase|nr:hypothetical protein [Holosporales bacterium]
MVIRSHAVAKVNLTLRITDKVERGYHKLQSVFVFLDEIFDTLTVDTAREFNGSSGNIAGVKASENLIKMAANILTSVFRKKVPHVEIKKEIPTGAGLGGGSSDAACFINVVFDLWQIPAKEKLICTKYFKALGSDTFIFLYYYFTNLNILFLDGAGFDGTITPLSIQNLHYCYLVIVFDGIFLSTKKVYDNFRGPFLPRINTNECDFELLKDFRNSLQEPAIMLVPKLQNYLRSIRATSPCFCGVSGSGSSCFGLYDTFEKAEKAMEILKSYGYCFLKMSRICPHEAKLRGFAFG